MTGGGRGGASWGAADLFKVKNLVLWCHQVAEEEGMQTPGIGYEQGRESFTVLPQEYFTGII